MKIVFKVFKSSGVLLNWSERGLIIQRNNIFKFCFVNPVFSSFFCIWMRLLQISTFLILKKFIMCHCNTVCFLVETCFIGMNMQSFKQRHSTTWHQRTNKTYVWSTIKYSIFEKNLHSFINTVLLRKCKIKTNTKKPINLYLVKHIFCYK